ncbi:TPA: hypothetical protein ACKRJ1_002532 [Pseudomonas aeruginosa]|nr:hypothetical protein [Pseudomonas aeruginosa]MBG4200010.1 hypothetical protein [Pseudomonas aeruginosa]
MWKTLTLISLLTLLAGCQNLQSPALVYPAEACTSNTPTSWCLLQKLKENYVIYNNGAQKSRAWSDGTVLAATGASVIGAATNAHSDLYKATGGIALTALGVSRYANFKTQSLATRVAASKLICAEAPLKSLLLRNGDLTGGPISQVTLPGSEERTLVLKDAGGGKISVQSAAAAAALTPNAPTVPAVDYLTIGSLVSTSDAVNENVDKAQRILSQINDEATRNLVGVQLAVINQIESDSFKIDEAIAVIKVAPPAPVTPNQGAKAALAGAPNILNDNKVAVEIIEEYNQYARCMKGDFDPVSF